MHSPCVQIPHPNFHLLLRPIEPSDMDPLVLHANNFETSQYLHAQFPYPYKKEDAQYFVENIVRPHPDRFRAIALGRLEDGACTELIGVISIVSMQDSSSDTAEIGYWLSPSYWGRGIMSQAVQVFVYQYVCRQFPNLLKLNAMVVLENQSSLRVLQKAGFVVKGVSNDPYSKHGRFWHQHILTLQLKRATK